MNLKLLSRLKTRDAAVVYEFLFERLNRSPGAIEETNFEKIAAELSSAGILTARGAAFTARVIRSKIEELEELEVVSREDVNAASFTLYVYLPYPRLPEEDEEKKPEPAVDHYGGRTLFDYAPVKTTPRAEPVAPSQNGNGNGNGNGEKTQRAINKENIINNKKINKARLDFEKSKEPKSSTVATPEPCKRTTDDIRTLVDFTSPPIAGLRALVCRRMWEPTTNPDLIDRVVALAALHVGGTRAVDLGVMIESAKDARDRYARTDGRAGRERIWETVCYQTKRIYETNGWKWTPTKLGAEPRPRDPMAEKRRRFLESVEND